MLHDEKILITGPAGRIAFGIAQSLVGDNEVWGVARFSDAASREKVEAFGVTTCTLDIASGEFGRPAGRLHLSPAHRRLISAPTTTTAALRANAEGTGFASSTAAPRRRRW